MTFFLGLSVPFILIAVYYFVLRKNPTVNTVASTVVTDTTKVVAAIDAAKAAVKTPAPPAAPKS